jgi:putative hemolysin
VGGLLLTLTVLLALAGCASAGLGSGAPSGTPGQGTPGAPSPGASGTSGASADEAYCTAKGGTLVPRVATWNTNADPPAWLTLAGRQTFCEFETGSGDDTTRISVDLTTLSSTEPTLASVAYLSKVKTTSPPVVGQNPAQWSCAEDFLGSSAFGNTDAGGGWVDSSQPVFSVMDQCVFPDGSAIDAFGLWYHANGVIRGADLAPLFAYQPGDRLPALYEPAGRRP